MKALIEAHKLRRLIEATKKFISSDDNRRVLLQYIRLDFKKEGLTVQAFAIDGYRLALENTDCFDVDEDFTAYIKPFVPAIRTKNSIYATVEIVGKNCLIDIDGQIAGFRQLEGDKFNEQETLDNLQRNPVSFRIGFNGQYLLDAVQAAKASVSDFARTPVVLEFRGQRDAVIIRTGKDNIKAVLPIRLRDEESAATATNSHSASENNSPQE